MRSVEKVIKDYKHVCWYPSAGSDFRALLFLSDWYYKKNNVPMDKGQVLPDLFVMTDYLGLGDFYVNQSFWGDAYEQIMRGNCEPGSCLVHVSYKNSSTDIVVKRYERLCDLRLPFDSRLKCSEKPAVYNSAFLIEVEVISRSYDVVNRYETAVLYAAAENQLFAERILISRGLKTEYLVIMNYGAGFGGGNGISYKWILRDYKELGIRYAVSNQFPAGDGSDPDYPELTDFYGIDGVMWTRGNPVVWYRVENLLKNDQESNEVNLMENENDEKKIDEFKACLAASGVDTDGLDIKPNDSLWDILMKIGIGKIVVCDDARTFDTSDMERMREEGRVLGEIDVNKDE